MSDSAKPPARPYRSSAVRRAQIIEEASKLFAVQGIEATRVDDIVAAVGISCGTFYHHFPSKEDLVEAFVMGTMTMILERQRNWKNDPQLSPLDEFCRYLDLIDETHAFRVRMGLMRGTDREEPRLYAMALRLLMPKQVEIVADMLRRGRERGQFFVENVEATANLMAMTRLTALHHLPTLSERITWPAFRRVLRRQFSSMLGVDPSLTR